VGKEWGFAGERECGKLRVGLEGKKGA